MAKLQVLIVLLSLALGGKCPSSVKLIQVFCMRCHVTIGLLVTVLCQTSDKPTEETIETPSTEKNETSTAEEEEEDKPSIR